MIQFICRKLPYVSDRFSDVEVSFICKALRLIASVYAEFFSDVSLDAGTERDVIFLRIQSDSKHIYKLNF